MNFENVRMKWTSGAACPDGVYLNYIYHIIKKNGKLFFSDGNLELPTDKETLKQLFTPTDDISWSDVEFIETKTNKK